MPGVGYIFQSRDVQEIRQVIRLPGARLIPDGWVTKFSPYLGPSWEGSFRVESESGHIQADGSLVRIPLTESQLATLSVEVVSRKIVDAGRLAMEHGAQVLGLAHDAWSLGAYLGPLSDELDMPVSSGLALEVAALPRLLELAMRGAGARLERLHIAVLSADSVAGEQISRLLGGSAGFLTLQGTEMARLARIAGRLLHEQGMSVKVLRDARSAAAHADIVVLCGPRCPPVDGRWLMPDAVIARCGSNAQAMNGSAQLRPRQILVDQVLVALPPGRAGIAGTRGLDLGGGLVDVRPAEALVVAMSGKLRSLGIAGRVTLEEVDGIWRDAAYVGLRVAGFRSGSRVVLSPL